MTVYVLFSKPAEHTLSSAAVIYAIAWINIEPLVSFVSSLGLLPTIFTLLFMFRYTRLLVGLFAVWLYKPKLPQTHPVFSTKDVTVILPTVDPAGVNFEECMHSIQETDPFEIIIVTAGGGRGGRTNFEILEHSWKGYPAIRLMNCKVVNKRKQLCTAVSLVSVNCFLRWRSLIQRRWFGKNATGSSTYVGLTPSTDCECR